MADPNEGYRIEQTADGVEFIIPKRLQSPNSVIAVLAALAFVTLLIISIVAGVFAMSDDSSFLSGSRSAAIPKLYPNGYTYLMQFDSGVQQEIRDYGQRHLAEYISSVRTTIIIWWAGAAGSFVALFMLAFAGKPKIVEVRDDGVVIDRKAFFPRSELRGIFQRDGSKITVVAGISAITIVELAKAPHAGMILADLNAIAQRLWFHEN